jgi:hypothetical protein
MQDVKIDQHSLKKRWGYGTADRSLGSGVTVYVIAIFQQSDGDRFTLYLTDTNLILKETATNKTWSYRTETYTTGTITSVVDTTVTGSATAWDTSGLAAGDKFIVDSDHTIDEEPDSDWATIASITDATHLELTASYTGSGTGTYKARKVYGVPTNGRWAWATVNDTFCFTNGSVNVQKWTGTDYATNLDATYAVKARYCIEYANRLILADIVDTDGMTRLPYTIRWSGEGDPTSWDSGTDATAGEADLLETEDYITGLGKVGSTMVIYKRDNILFASRTGNSNTPFSIPQSEQIRGIGCIAPYSIVEVLGTNAFLGRDDFYIINANQPEPIGRDTIRYNFFEQVSDSEVENVWGFANTLDNQVIWIANTTAGKRAYAWNYVQKEWSIYNYSADITGAGRGAT